MQTSRNGLLFIACREAFVSVPYQDGDHFSYGFGHNSPTLKEGDTITPKRAFELLIEDVAKREVYLNKLLKWKVPQHQYDALMSLMYQSGNRYAPAACALVNAAELDVAAEFLPLCDRNKAGKKLNGLKIRREQEVKVFVNADYGDLTTIKMWHGNPKIVPMELYTVQPGDLLWPTQNLSSAN